MSIDWSTITKLRTFFNDFPEYDTNQLLSFEFEEYGDYLGTYTYLEKRKTKKHIKGI